MRSILLRRRTAVKRTLAPWRGVLSLPRLEALLGLVDDIDAALPAHEAIVAMAIAQRFQRIADFHGSTLGSSRVRTSPRRIKGSALYASNRRVDQEDAATLGQQPISLTGFDLNQTLRQARWDV